MVFNKVVNERDMIRIQKFYRVISFLTLIAFIFTNAGYADSYSWALRAPMNFAKMQGDSQDLRQLRDFSFDELQQRFPEGMTKPHVLRVYRYAVELARELGLEQEYIDMLGRVALVHDEGGWHWPLEKTGSMTKRIRGDYGKI